MKILVMGQAGAGKTTLAKALAKRLDALHYNADTVRKQFNDWDFSPEGRLRQASRMGKLCDDANSEDRTVIADFICPTKEAREAFGQAFVVWVDRIKQGRYVDTNELFEPPECDVTIPYGMTVDEEVDEVMEVYSKRI